MSDDWISSVSVSLDDVEDSPMATRNCHKVTIPSCCLKKRKLLHNAVCILKYYSIFIHLRKFVTSIPNVCKQEETERPIVDIFANTSREPQFS